MKKISVLLLIMMMSVAAVSAEESAKKEVEATEVKSTKKIPPFYLQGGVDFGYNEFWGLGYCAIPLTLGYKINDLISAQGTFNFYIPHEDNSVKSNIHTCKCFTFDVDVVFHFKNKKENAKLNKWLSTGMGFGSVTTEFKSSEKKTGVFQINVAGGLEKPFNEHFCIGGKVDVGFGGMLTAGAGAYARYNF